MLSKNKFLKLKRHTHTHKYDFYFYIWSIYIANMCPLGRPLWHADSDISSSVQLLTCISICREKKSNFFRNIFVLAIPESWQISQNEIWTLGALKGHGRNAEKHTQQIIICLFPKSICCRRYLLLSTLVNELNEGAK